MKGIETVNRDSVKVFFACGALLTVTIFLSLPSLLVADDEDLDEDFLQQKMEENGMNPQTSQVFKPPQMTDEERGSRHMPKHLRCAGCVAVAHQVCQYGCDKRSSFSCVCED
ncbi:marginal zone B- and B1-cell-specific protein [Elysia marginata]|uniref:Marginal zone B- and B1-cell-specific protein n=1 Tax=Elysia marginata TaxID=1093978 RepID=A0AAV4HSY8_9GAST|nr:marginal zone B- and B1-cell-specific protein [Elysia marginata]